MAATAPARRYLTLQDAAATYGVSVKTIRRRISDGTLPAVRVGPQLRILATDLDRIAQPVPTVAGAR